MMNSDVATATRVAQLNHIDPASLTQWPQVKAQAGETST
jgi:hypothetical protein